MRRTRTVETRTDRMALTRDAGIPKLSLVSVLAGVMVAYGTFVVVLGIVAAALHAAGVDTDVSRNDWQRLGTGAGLIIAAVLLVSYLFGGYVAGRMARRAGLTHGVLVFLLGVAVAVGVGAVVNALTDSSAVIANLRDLGIPTSRGEWAHVGTIAGIASLAGMLIGSLLGGAAGERWHSPPVTRAADPHHRPPVTHTPPRRPPLVTRPPPTPLDPPRAPPRRAGAAAPPPPPPTPSSTAAMPTTSSSIATRRSSTTAFATSPSVAGPPAARMST